MSPLIPRIRFDTDLLSASDRLARFSEALPIYELTPLGGGPDAFKAQIDAWSLGDLVVSSGCISPLRFVRAARTASLDRHDNLNFILLTRGTSTGDAEGRALSLGPGQIGAFDLSRPFLTEGTANENVALGVSRRAMKEFIAKMPDLHGRVLDGTPGRLMADHLLALVRFLPSVREADVPVLIRATLGLVAGCLASLPAAAGEPVPGFGVRNRARHQIERRLGSAELSPDRLCQDLGISRSTLNRAFLSDGGVATYIQGRRLEAVHTLLAHPHEGRSIAEIAYEFGFASASHFSNAFRSRFGYSPSHARLSAKQPAGEFPEASKDSETEQFRLWMQQLASR